MEALQVFMAWCRNLVQSIHISLSKHLIIKRMAMNIILKKNRWVEFNIFLISESRTRISIASRFFVRKHVNQMSYVQQCFSGVFLECRSNTRLAKSIPLKGWHYRIPHTYKQAGWGAATTTETMTVRRGLRKQCQKSHWARSDIGPESTHAHSKPFIITDENVQDKTMFLISSWLIQSNRHLKHTQKWHHKPKRTEIKYWPVILTLANESQSVVNTS